jgi:hypothetical protein
MEDVKNPPIVAETIAGIEQGKTIEPKRRGRPPKVRLPEGVVRAGEIGGPVNVDRMEPMPGVPGDVIEGAADETGVNSLTITRVPPEAVPVHVPACDVPQPVVMAEGTETIVTDGGRFTITTKLLADPLLTLHLRRVKNELTDAAHTVHIPASVLIPDGAKVVAHFYREE